MFRNIEKLKNKKFIVGKNPQGNGWLIKEIGGTHKVAQFGMDEAVPNSVSRLMALDNGKWTAHYSLDIDGDGQVKISNIKPQQHTYVNGVEVVAKIVNEGHTIELGHNRFGINLQTAIDAAASMAGQPKPPTGIYSISSLQDVWNEYERRTDAVQKRRKNIGLLRSIPMVFTMIGGAVTALCGPEIRPYAGVLTGVAIVVLLYGIYLSMTFDDIGATKKNTKYLHDNYRGPGCNHTLPSQPYDVLRQNTNCPFCKCQWTS